MMKKLKKLLFLSLALPILMTVHPECHAQNKGQKQYILEYYMENGDTVYVDTVPPVWIYPKGTRRQQRDWKKYTRLVHNFNAVYPYALLAKRVISEVDATIAAKGLKGSKEDAYINAWQKQILKDFEPIIRKMTISQGELLVRLVDREVGKTSYKIVKDYKNGIAAGFWQGVARLFGQNLKSPYDPNGKDIETEELVKAWEEGEFDLLYFSIFSRFPQPAPMPSKYR